MKYSEMDQNRLDSLTHPSHISEEHWVSVSRVEWDGLNDEVKLLRLAVSLARLFLKVEENQNSQLDRQGS